MERFWSFDLDKAIEFSVLNELLEKFRRWECAERRWMAEAWFVTVQRKGFIRAGRGEFVFGDNGHWLAGAGKSSVS